MKKQILTLGAVLLFAVSGFAQNPAALDPSFDPESNTSGVVESIALQPDGKILVTGHFSSRIARLNTDGSLDDSFHQPELWGAILKDVALLPDGKIIIVGNFTSYADVPVNHIVCLNADGTVDDAFNQGAGANNFVNCVKVQDDGKIIIAGSFTEYDGEPRGGVARLNSDGTLDDSFDTGTGLAGISGEAQSLDFQADGKILLAGLFYTYDGNESRFSVRLNSDGSFDPSYTAPLIGGGNASDRRIADIKAQPDGKIIIGGHFETVNGTTSKTIARLDSDGTTDASFNPGDGAQLTWGTLVTTTYTLPNGKILVGGKFNSFDGLPRNGIAQMNADGSHDTSFDPGAGFTDFLPYAMVGTILAQPDGKILVGGDFDKYNDVTRYNLARLQGDGGTTSVENIKERFTFEVYPNPAKKSVNISGAPQNATLRILDLSGKVIYEQFVMDNFESVNISGLKDGLYLLQMEKDGNISHKKLTVSN